MYCAMMFLFVFVIFSTITKSIGITDIEYAKLPPVFELDNFGRCLLFEDEALYCYVEYHLKPIDEENPGETWNHIQNLSANPRNYRHDQLRHGICIPLSCPNISRNYEDPEFKLHLAKCMDKKYEHLGIHGNIEHAYCQTNEPQEFDWLDTSAAVFLISYLLLILFSSCYEGLARLKSPKEYTEITASKRAQIITCFSIFKNWDRLKTIEWTPDNVKLRGVQGVRFFNLFLVIAAHAAILVMAGPISNTKFSETVLEKNLVMFLASGPYGVSSFFQISAMLVTYNVLKYFNEKSDRKLDLKSIFWIILYRYIRLTPSMAFILMIHATLLNHAGQGPFYGELLGIDRRNCRKNGWTNLLYVSNWIKPTEMCLVETWYLSVDMQAFILVLIILYFTAKNPKRFWWVLTGLWVANQAIVAWHIYQKKVFHYLKPYPEMIYEMRGLYEDDGVVMNTVYFTPMSLASTLTGTGVGFLIHKYDKLSVFDTKIGSFLTWTSVYVVAFGIVVIPGLWIFSPEYYESFWFSIPHLTLSTTIYSLAIAVGSLGVWSKSGWMTKWILEWPPMYYLGRLSYGTYLAHYTLACYFLASFSNLIHASQFIVLLEAGKLLATSMLLGLLLALFIEFPISALSSLLIKEKMMNENKKDEIKAKDS